MQGWGLPPTLLKSQPALTDLGSLCVPGWPSLAGRPTDGPGGRRIGLIAHIPTYNLFFLLRHLLPNVISFLELGVCVRHEVMQDPMDSQQKVRPVGKQPTATNSPKRPGGGPFVEPFEWRPSETRLASLRLVRLKTAVDGDSGLGRPGFADFAVRRIPN